MKRAEQTLAARVALAIIGALFVLGFVVGVAGCATVTTEKSQTFEERVAYVEGMAQAALRSVRDLTCPKWTAEGICETPGRVLSVSTASSMVERIAAARVALKVSAGMGSPGADCLGRVRTPNACLAAAQGVILEVNGLLRDMQQRRGT